MTEQEQLIFDGIVDDKNRYLSFENKNTCEFGYDRILRQEFTSTLHPGYTARIDMIWEEVYNEANVLGGYSCTQIVETLEVSV